MTATKSKKIPAFRDLIRSRNCDSKFQDKTKKTLEHNEVNTYLKQFKYESR